MSKLLVTGDFDINPRLIPPSLELEHIRIPKSYAEIKNALLNASAYILGGPEYLSRELLTNSPLLKNLVVMGTGTSSFVDLEAAQNHGVRVSNTPRMNTEAVAEFALATLIYSLAQSFHSIEDLRNGHSWVQTPRKSLNTLTVGFLGMGAISQKLLEKLSLLGVKSFVYYSRTRNLQLESEHALEYLEASKLGQRVDVLSIHATYTSVTHHFINKTFFENARPDIKILNFSHPSLVDPTELKYFLEKSGNAFCFMDGYYQEWTDNQGLKHDPQGLLSLSPKLFTATSHIAAQEEKVVQEIFQRALEILVQQLKESSNE